MGCLRYSQNQVFQFEDRVLTHLRTVIISKLMLQESFLFTWNNSGIQQSVWIHPTLSLSFEFDGVTVDPINHEWVAELLALANGPGGLRLSPEPAEAE